MCLSIGTPKINNFPFVPNGKLIIFRSPKIWVHYSFIILCSNSGTPKKHHFSFGTFGKVVMLGVTILKHFRVKYSQITGIKAIVSVVNNNLGENMFCRSPIVFVREI